MARTLENTTQGIAFEFAGEALTALPSGALWWHSRQLLVISDLHLGKSERMARRGGALLPPYEIQDTLIKLEADINTTKAQVIVCLGDSFDDGGAARSLTSEHSDWLQRLMADRRWVWIAGNHDPAPTMFGGTHLETLYEPPLMFRHIAVPKMRGEGEVSGHYHPKAKMKLQGTTLARPCFIMDRQRLILPAYGTYTGGLLTHEPAISDLMDKNATAILVGTPMVTIPMPR